ncbi:DnaG5, partial [Candidatus Magnetomorum sp. HK-1]
HDKKCKFVESVNYLQKYYDCSLKKQSVRSSIKNIETAVKNKVLVNGPQAIGDILKNNLLDNSIYKNNLKPESFETLENKIDQLSKQVEQIRSFIITIARKLNEK